MANTSEEFKHYVSLVDSKQIAISRACKELGISRQTWYNLLKPKSVKGPKQKPVKIPRPVGRPRKEIAPNLDAPKIDWDAVAAREKAEQREWLKNQEKATDVMVEFLNKTFPHLWCKLRFEHVDESAYWYSFELINNSNRQMWSISHMEVYSDEKI